MSATGRTGPAAFSRVVSYRRLHTLDDVLRAGLFLEVTCRGCGRRSIFAAAGFFGVISGATRLDRLAARMRCEGAPGTVDHLLKHVTGAGGIDKADVRRVRVNVDGKMIGSICDDQLYM